MRNLSLSLSVFVRFAIVAISFFVLTSVAFAETPKGIYYVTSDCQMVVTFPYQPSLVTSAGGTTKWLTYLNAFVSTTTTTYRNWSFSNGYNLKTLLESHGGTVVDGFTMTVDLLTIDDPYTVPTTATGTYSFWINLGSNADNYNAYYNYTIISPNVCIGDTSEADAFANFYETNTHFTSLTVSDLAGGVVKIDVDYNLDQTEIDTSVSALNPDNVSFGYATSGFPSFYSEDIDQSVDGVGSVSHTSSALPDGSYTGLVKFSNAGCSFGLSACPFPASYVYFDFTLSGGVVTASTTGEFYNNSYTDSYNESDSFVSNMANFFKTLIQSKHPFAWPLMTLEHLKQAAITPQDYDDISVEIPLTSVIDNATSTDGFLNFVEAQGYLTGIDTTISATPLATGCSHMDFTSDGGIDVCGRFRSITTYTLYLALMWFIGVLFIKLLPKSVNE